MGGGNPLHIFFLGSENTVRSIIAEAILNHVGHRSFRAFSAGLKPGESVHDGAYRILMENGISTEHLRPKPWQEYTLRSAPPIHAAIAVCEDFDTKILKNFPNEPYGLACPLPNPAAVNGSPSDTKAAFQVAFEITRIRIRWLLEIRAKNPAPEDFFKALKKAPYFSALG